VVKEGEEGDKFYMIVEGNLIAEKNHKKVFEFKEGEYFGEIALIRHMPRQASVKCMSPCKLISIERETFKRMFGPIEEILKRNEEKYKQYITA
jgi:cAMP-dependent protein kinase regulator